MSLGRRLEPFALSGQIMATRNFEGRVWPDPVDPGRMNIYAICGKCRWVIDEKVMPSQDVEIDFCLALDRHAGPCARLPIMFRRRLRPQLMEELVNPKCQHCNGHGKCPCILCRPQEGTAIFKHTCHVCMVVGWQAMAQTLRGGMK